MTAPLTRSRNRKQQILEEIHSICFRVIGYPKGGLDRMDKRVLVRILKELKMLEERAKPA